MEMSVPFLSVPTKKKVGKKTKLVNVNVASIILAAFFMVFGTFLGGVSRFLRGDSFFTQKPWIQSVKKKGRDDKFDWELLINVDKALNQIDFDVMACMQRSICWHVNESLMNVQDNQAGKLDKFISGFIK
jgi:hypothetical protein